MTFKKVALSFFALTIAVTPALAQGRWGERAEENAAGRAERAQIRKMEEEYQKEVAAAKAAAAAPAAPAPATVAAAPATPAPAEPAPAAPAPAPAQ